MRCALGGEGGLEGEKKKEEPSEDIPPHHHSEETPPLQLREEGCVFLFRRFLSSGSWCRRERASLLVAVGRRL